jgi:hypothetical protein
MTLQGHRALLFFWTTTASSIGATARASCSRQGAPRGSRGCRGRWLGGEVARRWCRVGGSTRRGRAGVDAGDATVAGVVVLQAIRTVTENTEDHRGFTEGLLPGAEFFRGELGGWGAVGVGFWGNSRDAGISGDHRGHREHREHREVFGGAGGVGLWVRFVFGGDPAPRTVLMVVFLGWLLVGALRFRASGWWRGRGAGWRARRGRRTRAGCCRGRPRGRGSRCRRAG